MVTLLLIVLLSGLVFLNVSLMKTYQYIPVNELRRRARGRDEYAKLLYQLRNYGFGLSSVLWGLTGISSAVLFIVLVQQLRWWAALPLMLLIIWAAFAWIPNGRVTKFGNRLARFVAPPLLKLVSLLQPLSQRLGRMIGRLSPVTVHTGLYEPEDIVHLLDKQATQADNRISSVEMRIIKGALSFGQLPIREVMTPRRMIHTVAVDEPVSPHSMDQLHSSGFSRFPVVKTDENGREQFVGTLYLKDLINHRDGGVVGDVMKKDVYYVNEEKTLSQVIDAFLKTKHHLFVVVNAFEETVGVISIEDVIEEVIGHEIVDEFDQYGDLRAVALNQAAKERTEHRDETV